MSKCGTGSDHCCWINGKVCSYLTNSKEPGFNWACSLRTREGSWDKVYETPEYVTVVKPKLLEAGITVDCGDWPPKGTRCRDCGQEG